MKNLVVKLFIVLVLLSGTAFAWGSKSADEEAATPEFTQVAAEHILVKTAAEAVEIKKEIDNGGSFEYYAMKYSMCPSSQNGGYLGYFGHGQMVPEFEKAAFETPVGEVSKPVYTQFGWHLIKVLDKK